MNTAEAYEDDEDLMIEEGEQAGEDVDLNAMAETAVAALADGKSKYAECIDALARIPRLDRAELEVLFKRIKEITGCGIAAIRKDYAAQVKAIELELTRCNSGQEKEASAGAGDFGISDEEMIEVIGADYAVLKANGKVGVIDLGQFREMLDGGRGDVTPEILGRQDFGMVTQNRFHYVKDAKGDVKKIPASKVFMERKSRKTFMGIDFEPREGMLPDNYLNGWRGWRYDIHKERKPGGSFKLLNDHMRNILCAGNEGDYNWLMTFIADIIQNPGRKLGSAVVLRGKKGTGKSFLTDTLDRIMRPYSFTVVNPTHLVGDWTDHLYGRELIIVEEAFWGGDKRHEGKLKSKITLDRMEFSKKFFSTLRVNDFSRLIFTTNEKWCAPTSWDRERRLFILDVDPSMQEEVEYFAAMRAELDAGGDEAFFDYLKTYVPPFKAGWDVLRTPPQTAALNDNKLYALTPGQRFFVRLIEEGEVVVNHSGEFTPQTVKLKVDGVGNKVNRVHGAALYDAFLRYLHAAGDRKQEAEPSRFKELVAEMLFAVRDGNAFTQRDVLGAPDMTEAQIAIAKQTGEYPTHKAIAFPSLTEVVRRHEEAGAFAFDLYGWED